MRIQIQNRKEGWKSDSAHGCTRIHNHQKAEDLILQPDPQGRNHYNSTLPLIFRSHSAIKFQATRIDRRRANWYVWTVVCLSACTLSVRVDCRRESSFSPELVSIKNLLFDLEGATLLSIQVFDWLAQVIVYIRTRLFFASWLNWRCHDAMSLTWFLKGELPCMFLS